MKAPEKGLMKAEIEQYRELGYLVMPNVLEAGRLAQICGIVDADAGKVATHVR